MENPAIDKEKNICTRCGDSTDQLFYHLDNQYYCNDCEEMYEEFLINDRKKKLDDEDLLASMCY